MNDKGSGKYSDIIAGMNWVKQEVATNKWPAVVVRPAARMLHAQHSAAQPAWRTCMDLLWVHLVAACLPPGVERRPRPRPCAQVMSLGGVSSPSVNNAAASLIEVLGGWGGVGCRGWGWGGGAWGLPALRQQATGGQHAGCALHMLLPLQAWIVWHGIRLFPSAVI